MYYAFYRLQKHPDIINLCYTYRKAIKQIENIDVNKMDISM